MSSSPAAPARIGADALEAFCCSGSSPTVHLLGAGKVGQAFLAHLAATPARLVALSDSSATVHDRGGLPCRALAAHKRAGRALAARDGAASVPLPLAIDLVAADVVVDATPSAPALAEAALARSRAVLRRGARLVLAAKDALAQAPAELLGAAHGARLGIAAVLGGTGAALQRELAELRATCTSVALVGNATTTALIEAIERGASVERALAQARARGLLEADPALDLDGTDAATKLAIVAGALWENALPRNLAADLRALDPALLRARARRGRTTRLVARAGRDGAASLRYEELERGAPLAVPSDRVAYGYRIGGRRLRLHVGRGLGPDGTARALLRDLLAPTAQGAA